MEKTIVVSGGFDPVHIGHVRMFKEASQHGKRRTIHARKRENRNTRSI